MLLITEYVALEGTSLPSGIEVVVHGCGENFPVDPTPDSTADPENRRVEAFFFDGVLGVQPPPPGKNSPAGSTSYPEWVRRAKRTEDHGIATSVPFRYGVPWELDAPWSAEAELRIVSIDGSEEHVFGRDEGVAVDEYRIFSIEHPVPGLLYRGAMVEGDVEFPLFGPVELAKVRTAGAKPDALPLPASDPPEDEAPPDVIQLENVAGHDEVDLLAVNAAAEAAPNSELPTALA
jgi:hypothetical protein